MRERPGKFAPSLPDFAYAHSGYSIRNLFTIKQYAISEINVDFTVSVTMLHPSRSIVEGVFMRRLESGERERQPVGRRLRNPDRRAALGDTRQGHIAPGAARELIEA